MGSLPQCRSSDYHYCAMTNRNDWLVLEEVATIARVSIETVRFWLRRPNRRLPSVRPGKRRLVRRSDLDAFLSATVSRP